MADETVQNVRRIGDAQQALTKLSAPPQVQQLDLQPSPPAAAGTATAAAAPGTGATSAPAPAAPRALPAPTITVNGAGEAMTNAQMAERAALGNTPDVAAAARARLASTAPPVAAAAPGVATPPPAAAAAPAATVGAAPAAAAPAAGPVPAAAATARPSFAERAGYAAGRAVSGSADTLGRVARFGAQPVETVPGRVLSTRTAPGQNGAAAGLLASSAIMTAPQIAMRSSEDYARRFGFNPNFGDGVGGLAKETGVRALGALTDLGAGILDTGLAPLDAVRRTFNPGAAPLETFGQIVQKQDNPQAAAIHEAASQGQPLPPDPATIGPPASAALFNGVTSGVSSNAPTAGGGNVDVPRVPRGAGSADPSTWSPSARAALSSQAPGTAVVNGQTYTADQINALANRNVISSDAFRNPAPGVAYSEATGGKTLELGQGPTSRSGGGGFTAADRQRQLEAIENGPDSRSDEARAAKARESMRNSLISDARNALRSGKRKTAGRLIELLTASNGADSADARIAAANRPQRQPAGRTDAQEALTAAQMEEAQANTVTARQKAAAESRLGGLQDALVNAKTPEEQQAAGRALALLTGRDLPQKKIGYIDVPIPGDPLGQKQRLPYDPEANQVLMPKGLTAVYTDAQGNQQRRPALQ